MEIYYMSHKGDKIDLMSDTISLPYPEELLTNDWCYTTSDRIGNGRKIKEIYKDASEQNLTIEILENDQDDFRKKLNEIHDIFETDIRNLKEGRIYFGEWYKKCFVISKNFANYDHLMDYILINSKMLCANPMWIKEINKTFEIQDDVYDTGMDYPFDYPFGYTPDSNSHAKWDTEHYAASDFQLCVYGPCSNPAVMINGHPYQVFTTLETGEYFMLDSKENTITKYLINGTTLNIYNSRQFTPSVFTKIPAGALTITWSGDFKFNIKLYLERSEPKWYVNSQSYKLATEDGHYLITEAGEHIALQTEG